MILYERKIRFDIKNILKFIKYVEDSKINIVLNIMLEFDMKSCNIQKNIYL